MTQYRKKLKFIFVYNGLAHKKIVYKICLNSAILVYCFIDRHFLYGYSQMAKVMLTRLLVA